MAIKLEHQIKHKHLKNPVKIISACLTESDFNYGADPLREFDKTALALDYGGILFSYLCSENFYTISVPKQKREQAKKIVNKYFQKNQ